jgi:flagellar M-ring protein FliF
VAPGGQVDRLSVAVIVDDARTPGADGAPATSKPREPAEMERIKSLVAASVGLDADRGDQLTVENIAFEEPVEAPADVAAPWWKNVAPTVVSTLGVSVGDLMRWAVVGLVALFALFAVIRPLAKAALGPPGPTVLAPAIVAGAGALPAAKTVAELESALQAAAVQSGPATGVPALARSIGAKVEHDPEQVAQLLRAMLAHEEK